MLISVLHYFRYRCVQTTKFVLQLKISHAFTSRVHTGFPPGGGGSTCVCTPFFGFFALCCSCCARSNSAILRRFELICCSTSSSSFLISAYLSLLISSLSAPARRRRSQLKALCKGVSRSDLSSVHALVIGGRTSSFPEIISGVGSAYLHSVCTGKNKLDSPAGSIGASYVILS